MISCRNEGSSYSFEKIDEAEDIVQAKFKVLYL